MDESDGKFLVKLARKALEQHLTTGMVLKPPSGIKNEFFENRGVFVTIHTYPEGALRGCIGFPEPRKPLVNGVIEAAILAATDDPRFYPVQKEELPHVSIDVTVLTPPRLIQADKPEDVIKNFEIGKHGLIIEKGFHRGLLLPQVPVEQGWNKNEFLEGLCMKAGLLSGAWADSRTRLYRFEGKVFSEHIP